jgi:hypothetical protein
MNQGTAANCAADNPEGKRRMIKLSITAVVFGCAMSLLAIWLYNQNTLQKPLEKVLASDPRNHAIHPTAHFDGWIDTESLVFDLNKVADDSTQADIFRVFLQYAKAQKDRHFKRVVLAAYGKKKFIVPGEYFQQLGQEFGTQNPAYTFRTFAHHVATPDGARPFPEMDGGLLWVLGRELEQFSEFNKEWYLNDYAARHK